MVEEPGAADPDRSGDLFDRGGVEPFVDDRVMRDGKDTLARASAGGSDVQRLVHCLTHGLVGRRAVVPGLTARNATV